MVLVVLGVGGDLVVLSFNGRTSDFDSENAGSSPARTATPV